MEKSEKTRTTQNAKLKRKDLIYENMKKIDFS